MDQASLGLKIAAVQKRLEARRAAMTQQRTMAASLKTFVAPALGLSATSLLGGVTRGLQAAALSFVVGKISKVFRR
jgi:hypothetical protein